MRASLSAALFFLFGAITVGEAGADLGKLDARARVALERVRGAGRFGDPIRSPEVSALTGSGRLDVFIEGAIDRAALEAAGARVRTELPGLCTADVPVDAIEAIAALPGVSRIRGAAPVELELDMSVPAIGAAALRGAGPGFSGVNGQGVLIGAVDSGVDFDHGDLKDANGKTRLIRIWDQSAVGVPPPAFQYGAEWSNAEIDQGACPETDEIGHGTHILGVAGGDGSQTGGTVPAYTYAGVAPRADLAMVKTNFTNTGIVDGVRYLFDLAAQRHQNAVVNLSVGTQFGPHDGSDAFETAVAALTGPGRIIVKSAGNDRGGTRHAQVKAAGAGTAVTMSVAGSALGRGVQIDGYYEWTENMGIRITTPSGSVVGPIVRGTRNAAFPGTLTANGSVYVENGVTRTQGADYQVYIEINAQPGEVMDGTWTFTFIPLSLGVAHGEVDLWRFFASPGVSANFVAGNQPNEKLVSEPGNANEIITAGGWVTKRNWVNCGGQTMSLNPAAEGTIAWFSSPGPTRDGRPKPDITGPATAVVSSAAFDVTPACAANPELMGDGLNHMVDYGTSVAAAHVTGVAALLMQVRGALTPNQIRNYLVGNAVHDANTGAGWNPDWGYGKLRIAPNTAPVSDPAPAAALDIQAITPNPTSHVARIAYALPRASEVRLEIVDVQGRAVATLFRGFQEAGRHEAVWDGGKDGARAPAGLYFVLVHTPEARTLKRLVLTR